MTSAKRRAALEEFDRALGKYPGAAEYLDQQRAVERRNTSASTFYEGLRPQPLNGGALRTA